MINSRETPDFTIRLAPVFYTVIRRVVDVRHEEVRIPYRIQAACCADVLSMHVKLTVQFSV